MEERTELRSDEMAKKILVVDDEELITKTVGNLLKREGYEVIVCESGFQAQKEIENNKDFDLIVADIRMPGINGLETIKNIKKYLKTRNKPDVHVIFITGYADSDAHIKAEKFGKVIFKPFDIRDFLSEVKKSLSSK